MSADVVVLVFGDVNGQFSRLFRKINKLVSKLKNVGMGICVGNFFAESCDDEWKKVLSGELQAPIQIFILGPTSSKLRRFYTDCFNMTDLTDRITYFGKSGTFRTVEGLKLAFVSGQFDELKTSELTYSIKDINKLVKDTMSGRIDLLLTWSWPNDFGRLQEKDQRSGTTEMSSTFLFSYLAPQYHLAARERESTLVTVERFYDDDTSAGISRFIGLTYLDEGSGTTWIKALRITPYAVKQTDQKRNPQQIVPLPLSGVAEISQKIEIHIYSEPHQKCYSASCVKCASTRAPKRRKTNGEEKFQKREELPCWFCFSNPDFEKQMVIAVGEHSFLTIAKGPVVDDHLLISSICHLPSMRVVKEDVRNEIYMFKNAIRKVCGQLFFPVFYERSFKSNHLQIQCVPVPIEKYNCIAPAYKKLAEECDLHITEFEDNKLSYMMLEEKEKYFHVDLSNGHELLISGTTSSFFPINFGREALLVKSLLNMPEKKDWKKCLQSREFEIELVKRFRQRFRKYDFT